MGILDDAIREHLELKRQHGAPGDDVERLEKEAFGPPTRPGDPDFEDEADGEAEDDQPDAPEAGEPETGDPVADFETIEPDSEEQMTPAEQARIEHSDLGDTVDHPVLPGPDTAEEQALAREATEAPEAAIFDQASDADEDEDGFGDLDLDLDLGDEEGAESAPAPSAQAEQAPPAPAVEEEDDDLEIDFDLDDLGDEPEPSPEPAPEPTAEHEPVTPLPPETGEEDAPPAPAEGFVADDEAEDELEDEDEDLLEETPEFLKDTPEGERLWFEQDEPKDFDFDD